MPPLLAPARVLVADSDAAFARELALALESEPQIEVVGWSSDGPEALELTRTYVPDVVLVAVDLPDIAELLEELAAIEPRTPKLILTGMDGTNVEILAGDPPVKASGFVRRGETVDAMTTMVVVLVALSNVSASDLDGSAV